MRGSGLQRTYDHLPPWLQRVGLNAYGVHTRVATARFETLVSRMAPSETWPVEAQRQYVADRLRDLLAHAIRHVPRYRGLYRLLPDLCGSNAAVMAVLAEFPRVTRAEILADRDAFLSDSFRRRHLVATRTSGTTGTPMETLVERPALRASNALWWRRTLWAGHVSGDWTARLVGDHVVRLDDAAPSRPYRISHVDRRIYLSTFHLDERAAATFKSLLEERRPAFLQGYPSALASLSSLAGACDERWRPKAVLYSSEPLYEHQREAVSAFVDAPIRGLYGCAERIVSAAECESGALHLSLLDGYVDGQFEDDGSPEAPSVTGLLNRAMPLIRFELGDGLVFRHGAACPCGRTLPVLEPVVTKMEDSLATPSGRAVSPSALTWALKDLTGVRCSQIVQRPDLSVDVRVVADSARAQELEQTLARRVSRMLFEEVPVRVVFVDDLNVTASGKSRFVVRELPGGAVARAHEAPLSRG